MTPDTGNTLFELVGAFMAWRNALQLWRDREVKGVYWPIYYFYTAWGVWNLYYYPSLGQWGSTFAGAVLCAGNAVWIVLASRIALERRRCVAYRYAAAERAALRHELYESGLISAAEFEDR